MGYLFIIAMLLPAIVYYFLFHNSKDCLPTNWPFVGMLPIFLKNHLRLNDFIIELMEKSRLCFHFHGPWFSNIQYIFTIDPANIHHVTSKKFENYGNGSKLNDSLEIFGNGIANTDSTLWTNHRKLALSFFNQSKFHEFLVNLTLTKIKCGLFPILEHAYKHDIVIDIQDLFLRFMYDTMCIVMMDHDLMSLSVELPSFPLKTAVADVEHGMVYRHIVPTFVWTFLRRLNVGYERKMKIAYRTLDNLIYKCIDRNREEKKKKASEVEGDNHGNEVSANLLTFLMNEGEKKGAPIRYNNDKFLRDNIINFFVAGAETTSTALTWFFCLLWKNPRVLEKIKEELEQERINDESISIDLNQINNKLIYLHAVICETLRLYPPLASTTKTTIESDILPSGHPVKKNTEIIFNSYAMGRNKSVWGDDCCDFKPERWITQDGMIKHEPSYKFFVFGAGPRSCLGKQMAFNLIKIIAANIIQHYRIEAVEKCHVPQSAMVLRMKCGFRVKVFRTSQSCLKDSEVVVVRDAIL